jgi:hypothetical protein
MIARAVAAVMFAGLAVGTASTAWAAPTMSGHYIETESGPNARTVTSDWYATPCGDGCAAIAVKDPAARGWQAQLVNGQWTMDSTSDGACTDGTTVPLAMTAHYTWDPNTLAGTVQNTVNVAACGQPAGFNFTNNVQLRQVA